MTISKRLYLILIYLTALATITSCSGGSTAGIEGTSLAFRHAKLVSIKQGDGYAIADITNPWAKDSTGVLLHRYILVPRNQDLPSDLPEGEVVRTPIQKAVFFTSVHASLINQLGAYDAIKGVCDLEYMYLDKIQQDVKAGRIVDCGIGTNPSIEKIIDLSPEAIVLSPFENSGSYGKLGKIGISLIESADYMETSALGRAEWMRFYGMLFGVENRADSLFLAIESEYDSLKALVADVKYKPTVVTEKKFGSSWYVAGGNSTVGGLLKDAGADYIFKNEKASGSVPYAPEKVFDEANEADIWLLKYNQAEPLTYSQLASEWSSYAQMKPFVNHRIYTCNLSKVPFYEETPFHPNLLLKDYINIIHPEVLHDKTMRYYQLMPATAADTPVGGGK